MKGSDAISSTSPRDEETASSPLSPDRVKRFALTGPSVRLDPARHAYRSDVADVALAGRVIASHYAEPVMRTFIVEAALSLTPAPGAAPQATMVAGDRFAVLDCGRSLAWGYAEQSGLVGYVDEEALA